MFIWDRSRQLHFQTINHPHSNMALMTAIRSIGSLLAGNSILSEDEKIVIFSDALNHASIIDGIRLAGRQKGVRVYIYRHCDMYHLNMLLSHCGMKRKIVVTDSLFSMDGDFAPMVEFAKLRKKYGFLLVIDDAHGTFVCGTWRWYWWGVQLWEWCGHMHWCPK